MEDEESRRKKVVLAIDGSPSSCRAFQYYLDDLNQPDDDIILLYCPKANEKSRQNVDGSWILVWEPELTQWIPLEETFKVELNARQLEAKFVTEPTNHPGSEIIRYLSENKASYVVVGTRILGTLQRTFLGSVSSYILHNAPCTVVVYKDIEIVMTKGRSRSSSTLSRDRSSSLNKERTTMDRSSSFTKARSSSSSSAPPIKELYKADEHEEITLEPGSSISVTMTTKL